MESTAKDRRPSGPRTIVQKIWDRHTILEEGGQSLLYVDRVMVSEGSIHAFDVLNGSGRKVRREKQVFAVPDHYAASGGPTLADIVDDERRAMIEVLDENARTHGVTQFGLGDSRRGIQHVVAVEQALTQPGIIILCGDSHTSTQGAVGALAFGIGGELSHVLATQCLWQRKPKVMKVEIDGALPHGVTAKDVILALIGKIGAAGAVGYAIEYCGSLIRSLSVEGRLTICNMSIEAGSRAGIVGPDETTYQYLSGRAYAPRGAAWDRALAYWRTLPTDGEAAFDNSVTLDAGTLEPMVTWGNSPENAIGISGRVPDPDQEPDLQRRAGMIRSLEYMDLVPGTRMTDISVDQVFIGSCTNSRIEDLRLAAAYTKGRKAVVPTLVVPGSGLVKKQAEAEGLDRVFKEAGFSWGEAGCSMCVSMNGDTVAPGLRCASTSNRNFRGRQGKGSRTHLVSPIMAVAAAVSGRLTDIRTLKTE